MQDRCLVKRESLAASTALGKIKLAKLPKGRKYKTRRCEIVIESGAAGDVTVQILVGDSVLLPTDGVFNSDLSKNVSTAKIDIPEGSTLFIQRKNANATTAYVYSVLLDLEETPA